MNVFSRYTFWLCSALLWYATFVFYPKWQNKGTEAVISWDVCGYYYYLPAVFIYKDLKKVDFQEKIEKKYGFQGGSPYSAFPHPSGNRVMKYSSGMAFLYAPAFFIAHFLAEPLGFEADGFSTPYHLAIAIWGILWAMLGLWYLRKLLLKWGFSDKITALTLFLYVFGTNYLDYASITSPMTHNYIFTLYALLLWQLSKFYATQNPNTPSVFTAFSIGALIGFAALTRPTELPIALLALMWGVGSFKDIKERFSFFNQHKSRVFIAIFTCLAIGSVQFLYWKWTAGQFFYKSYGPEDYMEWTRPHIIDGLFSAKKGWLAYTPIMFLSVLGFYFLYKKYYSHFYPIVAFIILFIYISFAHNIWTYGGSLGQRQMIQLYPVLAFPFAAFLEGISTNKIGRILTLLFSIIGVYLNLWWTYQAHKGTMFEATDMTPAYFRRVLGRWSVPPETKKLLDNRYDYTGEKKDSHIIYKNDFETDTTANADTTHVISGKKSIVVDVNHPFSIKYPISLTEKNKKWLRASATFRTTVSERTVWSMTQFMLFFTKNGEIKHGHFIRPQRLMVDNETKRIWLDVKMKRVADCDAIQLGFAISGGDKTIYIDDVEVEVFDEK